MWVLYSLDVDLDIAMIVAALAPSILIIVTYYYGSQRVKEHHSDNKEALNAIKVAVNGRLTDALDRLEKLEKVSKEKLRRIEKLEEVSKGKKTNERKV